MQLTATKTKNPADGSPCWMVSGPEGAITFDTLGPRLQILSVDGGIDPMGSRWVEQVREYAELGDEDAIYEVLADHYCTQLAGQVTR